MDQHDELELRDYVEILRRRWIWLVVPLVLLPVLAVVYTATRPASYSASASVILQTSAAQDALGQEVFNTSKLSREMANEINVALSDRVEAQVEASLGYLPGVSVSAADDADLLSFSAVGGDPDTVALEANTWAAAYVAESQARSVESVDAAVEQFRSRLQELRAERNELLAPLVSLQERQAAATSETLIASLQRQIDRLDTELAPERDLIDVQVSSIARSISNLELSGELAATGTARINDLAVAPSSSTNPSPARNGVLGLVVGGILGVGAALLAENMDRRIRTADDVVGATGVPVLASIPRPKGRSVEPGREVMGNPTGATANSYAQARAALTFAQATRSLRTILVTSANRSEGKTSTSANLAASVASSGKTVALLDLDFHRPRLHDVFETEQAPGLTDHIVGGIDLAVCGKVVSFPSGGRLAFVRAGSLPPNAVDLLTSPSLEAAVEDIAAQVDLLIIDAPPVLPIADTALLVRLVDGVLITAFRKQTTRDQLEETMRRLTTVDARVVGALLIGSKPNKTYDEYVRNPGDTASAPLRMTPVPSESSRPAPPDLHAVNGNGHRSAGLNGANGHNGEAMTNGHAPQPAPVRIPARPDRPSE